MRRRTLSFCVVVATVAVTTQTAAACDRAAHAAGACQGCTVKLTASAFQDSDPSAAGLGLTTGMSGRLRMSVEGACHLPAGARLELRAQALDANGNRVGPVRVMKTCPPTDCMVSVRKKTAGGYVFQAFLVGCGKKSHRLTAVWAGDGSGSGGGGGGSGGGGTQPRWKLTKVTQGNGFSGDCTVSTPTVGSPNGHAELRVNGSHGEFEWQLPTVVTTGTTATFTTHYHTESNADDTSGFGVAVPDIWGVTPNTFRVDATAPAHGDAPVNTQTRTFTISAGRGYSPGATALILINVCSDSYYYTYTAQ